MWEEAVCRTHHQEEGGEDMKINSPEELMKQFSYVSDTELSLADIQWLIKNIKELIAPKPNKG